MKDIKFPIYLLLFGFLLSFVSCDKDDPINPGTDGKDTIFSMTYKVNGTSVTSTKSLANPLITQLYPSIDSLPVATFAGDSLMMGAGALFNNYQSTLLMAIKTTNKSNMVGSYNFASDILNLKSGEALGIFDGKNGDILTYGFGIASLEYAAGSKVAITKHSNNRISGTFNFKIVNKADQSVFYDVTEGKFENFKITN